MAGRAQLFDLPLGAANNLALVAEHLPWRTNLWEPAGYYALLGKAPGTAIRYFKAAAAVGALSHDGYLQFGDAYEQTGNLFTASQIWEAAIQIYGPSEGSLIRLANTWRETKDYPSLINTLKQIVNLKSFDFNQPSEAIQLYYELGMLLAAHEPASAPPYLLQAVELDPALKDASELAFSIQRALPEGNPAYSLMESGRKLAGLGKWDLAAYAFQKVIESRPDYVEAWAFLGEALQHVEPPRSQDAHAALKKAVEIDPGSLPANTFMALYWRRSGDPDLSLEFLSIAGEIEPNNPDILVDLGAATAIVGDLETANSYFLKAIELTSRDPVYLRQFVSFCMQYNYNLEEIALPIAREAVLSAPDDPVSLDVMGQVLFRLGDLLNAERFLRRAVNYAPDYAPAHLHLGLVYNLQDKTSLANESFARAISLAPGTQTAILAERFFDDSAKP